MSYKRKTIDKFFIAHKYGFDGKKVIMEWSFDNEQECDKKLAELNAFCQ